MSIQIPADTTLRVETNTDGSLTLHFDRKRPLEPETTAIEETEIEDADVTAVADDAATTFTLKRHKTAVFDEKMALAKTLVATQGNDARTTAIERMFVERCEEKPGDELIEGTASTFSRFIRSVIASFHRPNARPDVPHDQDGQAGGPEDVE